MLKIFIIGITGQDGINLAQLLLHKSGFDIYGCYRDDNKLQNISDIIDKIHLLKFDLTNRDLIEKTFQKYLPDLIFNFASSQPQYNESNIKMFEVNTMSTLYLLDCIIKYKKKCKYLSSGSCLEFDNNEQKIVNLTSKCNPSGIYGITKLTNRHLINYYRNNYNIYAIHVVLFNHESSNRNELFATKKIAKGLTHIKYCIDNKIEFSSLKVGNIFSQRDWGDSRDYVEAMWLMINNDKPINYILSSNEEHTLKNYIDLCCEYLGMNDINWLNDKLYFNNMLILESDHTLYRTNDKNLIGDNTETLKILNWKPKYSFENMVRDIINFELQILFVP